MCNTAQKLEMFGQCCLQALRHRVVREVRALVVLPIRDLAAQVFKVFTTYCQDTPLKVKHTATLMIKSSLGFN